MSKDTHKDFLHRENIRAFQERLTSETDPGMRGLLIQLLAEERARKRSLPKPLTSVVGANNASLASFASTNAVISEISESLSLTPTAVAGVTFTTDCAYTFTRARFSDG